MKLTKQQARLHTQAESRLAQDVLITKELAP